MERRSSLRCGGAAPAVSLDGRKGCVASGLPVSAPGRLAYEAASIAYWGGGCRSSRAQFRIVAVSPSGADNGKPARQGLRGWGPPDSRISGEFRSVGGGNSANTVSRCHPRELSIGAAPVGVRRLPRVRGRRRTERSPRTLQYQGAELVSHRIAGGLSIFDDVTQLSHVPPPRVAGESPSHHSGAIQRSAVTPELKWKRQ